MTILSRLIAAASLIAAATLAPGPASADDRRGRHERDEDRGERHDRRGWRDPAPGHVHDRSCGHDARFQAPDWATRADLRWDGRAWVHAGWQRHELGERQVRARAVRLELLELDRDRAAFHARFGHARGKLARYDARYFERRADLERALQRLTWYAWR